MKLMKNIVLMSLVFALILTGCSSKTEEPNTATTSEETASEGVKVINLEDVFKKAAALKSYSYELVTVSPMGTFTTTFFTDGENMKNVTKMSQGESVTIVTKDKSVTYDPTTKMGMSYSLDIASMDSITKEQDKVTIDTDEKYEILGEETVNGYPCVIISSGSEDAGEGKIWVSKEYGIMIKMTAKDLESGQLMEMNCQNIKLGSLPADTFKVPSDIKIVEAGKYPIDGQ